MGTYNNVYVIPYLGRDRLAVSVIAVEGGLHVYGATSHTPSMQASSSLYQLEAMMSLKSSGTPAVGFKPGNEFG
jgi:hypothetical protein